MSNNDKDDILKRINELEKSSGASPQIDADSKDNVDKQFNEMYSYLMDEAGVDAGYGSGYEQPYDAEGGHTREEAEAEYEKLFRELHGIPEEEEFAARQKNKVFVVGHVNPDMDSIASSIAYAKLKNEIDRTAQYIPCRAGKINEETEYVLKSLEMDAPEYIGGAGSQIMDIDIRELPGVPESITLKWAWELLKEKRIVTLPVTEKVECSQSDQENKADNAEDAMSSLANNYEPKEKLKGLITVQDIGSIYMDAAGLDMLSKAETPFENIMEAIQGELVVDNDIHTAKKGKVLVAAADSDTIKDYVEKDDIVIVSNIVESQSTAIKAGASLIVVTMGAEVDSKVKDLARDNGCAIISTNHDTYTTARLMNQSIPVSYAMVTDELVTFKTTDYLDYVKKVMAKEKYRDFPVIDEDGYYVGMISRRFLVDAKRKKLILVDHNEKTQAIEDVSDAEILEIIDHHRLGGVETIEPVFFRNEPVGSTSTIVFEMYKENGVEIDKSIAHLLCAGILSDTLMFKSPTTSQKDKVAAIELAGLAGIDMQGYAAAMFRAGSVAGEKDAKDLIKHDFKKFTVDGTEIGISQYNSMDNEELISIKEKVIGLLDEERNNKNLDMLFYMLTDIVAGSTEVLFSGTDAKDTLVEAFEIAAEGDSIQIDGLISRKKQMVPEIIGAIKE